MQMFWTWDRGGIVGKQYNQVSSAVRVGVELVLTSVLGAALIWLLSYGANRLGHFVHNFLGLKPDDDPVDMWGLGMLTLLVIVGAYWLGKFVRFAVGELMRSY
jgi:hypothetical protein